MLGLFGVGWVREGFLAWFASYLYASGAVAEGTTFYTAVTTVITLAGMIGSLAGGYVSDKCFGSRRGPVAFFYCACQVVVLAAFGPAAHWGGPGILIAMIGMLSSVLFGALTLLMGAASVDYIDPKLTGTVSGLMNSSQYVGAGLAAWIVGSLVEAFGWDAFAPMLMIGAVISTAAMWKLMHNSAERRSTDTASV